MDICAPCDRYRREGWGEWLKLEDCCLNCRHLEDLLPCPVLQKRLYPSYPATRPVGGGGPERAIRSSTTCAVTGGSGGAGGES